MYLPNSIPTTISDAFTGNHTRAFLSDGTNDCLFNVTLDDSEQDASDVSSHAIEDGSDISDHVIQKPKVINLNIVLSDESISNTTPMSYSAAFIDTIQDRKQLLQNWMDDKTILTYHGHDVDIDDVVIESLSRNHSADTGSGLGLGMTLVQINIATSEEVVIKFNTVKKAGKSITNKTKKDGVKQKSILTSMFG
jgi:hypothetical protein